VSREWRDSNRLAAKSVRAGKAPFVLYELEKHSVRLRPSVTASDPNSVSFSGFLRAFGVAEARQRSGEY